MLSARIRDFFAPTLLIKFTANNDINAIGKSLNASKKPSLS